MKEVVLYHVRSVPTEVLERVLDLGKASLPRDYRHTQPEEENNRPLHNDEQPDSGGRE